MRPDIAATYIAERVELSFEELRYGVRLCYLSPEEAIRLMVTRVRAAASDMADWEWEIAALLVGEEEAVTDILRLESPVDPAAGEVWMYLVLSWLRDHRSTFPDVFSVVDQVFEDFGFPDEMEGLVTYMPAPADVPVGLAAMDQRWQAFIARRADHFRYRDNG